MVLSHEVLRAPLTQDIESPDTIPRRSPGLKILPDVAHARMSEQAIRVRLEQHALDIIVKGPPKKPEPKGQHKSVLWRRENRRRKNVSERVSQYRFAGT